MMLVGLGEPTVSLPAIAVLLDTAYRTKYAQTYLRLVLTGNAGAATL